ncbi:MAG: hypothetical protein EA405_09160 [Rhodospirillales bacterium]|nr:MAG: hypothetical protein EA405_09160 [Rhodospirillales bacterium]
MRYAGYRQRIDFLLGHGYRLFYLDREGCPLPLGAAAILDHASRCDRTRRFLHGLDNLFLRHPDRRAGALH